MERTSLIQFLNNAALFASAIFIPLIAKELGASAFEIGLVVGIYNLTYFSSNYLFSILADRLRINRLVQFGLLFAAVCFCSQLFIRDLFTLIGARLLVGLAAGTFPAALAVYAFQEREGKMGKFSAFTSLGWAFGSIIAGLVGSYELIFALSAFMLLISFFVAGPLPAIKSEQPGRLFPIRLIKRNIRIYFPYGLRAIGAQASWSIFPLFLIFAGADKFLVGVTYFINLGAQFFLMQHVERFRNLYLINFGLLGSVATFILYALFPNIWVIMPVQLLLAASFSTLQVGAQQELLAHNREKASAIGLLNSIANITAVAGPFIAGAVAEGFGYVGVMWLSAIVAFLGLISFTTVLE